MSARSAGGKTPSSPTPTASSFAAADSASAKTPTASQEVVVESPSLSSSNALARFEFEPGRSKDGTKILMVEWEDDDTTRGIAGDWAVSWEAKRTVLPAKDVADGGINRLYFLLPAGERVPSTVTLTLSGAARGTAEQRHISWKTNPLPAIFSPELGASAREAGKKGVLHTIWAKKRLQVLSREIDAESQRNVEGIALQMALQEREWIEQNFGVASRPTPALGNATVSSPTAPQEGAGALATSGLASPQSPRSPGGSRLMEKLKGLKLETSDRELDVRRSRPGEPNPLSPEQSDVAISSFGTFAALKGASSSTASLAAKPAQPPRRIAAQRPPDTLQQQQQRQLGAGAGSLNAFADAHTGFTGVVRDEEREDDLFALPMSPRSPGMSKSPFSFGAEETMRYVRGEKV